MQSEHFEGQLKIRDVFWQKCVATKIKNKSESPCPNVIFSRHVDRL